MDLRMTCGCWPCPVSVDLLQQGPKCSSTLQVLQSSQWRLCHALSLRRLPSGGSDFRTGRAETDVPTYAVTSAWLGKASSFNKLQLSARGFSWFGLARYCPGFPWIFPWFICRIQKNVFFSHLGIAWSVWVCHNAESQPATDASSPMSRSTPQESAGQMHWNGFPLYD